MAAAAHPPASERAPRPPPPPGEPRHAGGSAQARGRGPGHTRTPHGRAGRSARPAARVSSADQGPRLRRDVRGVGGAREGPASRRSVGGAWGRRGWGCTLKAAGLYGPRPPELGAVSWWGPHLETATPSNKPCGPQGLLCFGGRPPGTYSRQVHLGVGLTKRQARSQSDLPLLTSSRGSCTSQRLQGTCKGRC